MILKVNGGKIPVNRAKLAAGMARGHPVLRLPASRAQDHIYGAPLSVNASIHLPVRVAARNQFAILHPERFNR